jgi:hypothetical protein
MERSISDQWVEGKRAIDVFSGGELPVHIPQLAF